MNLEYIILNEISQSQKKKHRMVSFVRRMRDSQIRRKVVAKALGEGGVEALQGEIVLKIGCTAM